MWDALCCSADTCRASCGPRGPPGGAEEADQIHSHQGKETADQNMHYQYSVIAV